MNGTITGMLMLSALLIAAGGVRAEPQRQAKQANVAMKIKVYSAKEGKLIMSDRVAKTDAEWKKQLTPEQFHILREKGTERPFSGKLLNIHDKGVFRCGGCDLDLFGSEAKFESGTGWPSFTKPIAPENVTTRADNSFFSKRTEVLCARCGGHLGHVFDDGPPPTGLRYCMNSGAMKFVPATVLDGGAPTGKR